MPSVYFPSTDQGHHAHHSIDDTKKASDDTYSRDIPVSFRGAIVSISIEKKEEKYGCRRR